MKRHKILRKIVWGASSFCVCLVLYLSLAFLMLGGEKAEADTGTESVPYESAEEFSILLACDELEQFCGIIVYPRDARITAVLFDTRADAEGYCEHYSRRVEYSKKTEIDVIGRIGGIVIDAENGYNEYNSTYAGDHGTQRLFGSRVLELAEDSALRADIAYEFLYSLLGTNLDESDFSYIFASCSTDISYVDFCKYFPLLQRLRENITVTLG